MLLSPPARVQRKDGTKVIMERQPSFRKEMREMLHLVSRKEVLLITPLIFQGTFSEAFMNTFLSCESSPSTWHSSVDFIFSVHFTVRARALGSFLSAITAIIANFGLGVRFSPSHHSTGHTNH